MKCAGCGVESANKQFFNSVRGTFSSRSRPFCAACFVDKDNAVLNVIFWSFPCLGFIGLLLIVAYPRLAIGTWSLNISFWMAAFLASTILHELGHAVAGTLAGFRIFRLEIGMGLTISEFKWAGFRWRFQTIPFGGRVYGVPKKLDGYRLNRSLFILGGPAVNLILALISCIFLWLDEVLKSTRLDGFEPIKVLVLSNCVLLTFSLWPHRFNSAQGKIANDALLLWQTWRQDTSKITATLPYLYLLESDECLRERKFGEAQKWLAEGLRAFPDNHWLKLSAATTLIFEEKLDQARDALRALVTEFEANNNLFPTLLNNIAYVDALLGRPELLSEADDYSQRALESSPTIIYFKGTRGIVLVELGRSDEGVPLLEEALRKIPEKAGKAIDACYLGIAADRRGKTSESAAYFSMARKLDPRCPLLSREKQPVNS